MHEVGRVVFFCGVGVSELQVEPLRASYLLYSF